MRVTMASSATRRNFLQVESSPTVRRSHSIYSVQAIAHCSISVPTSDPDYQRASPPLKPIEPYPACKNRDNQKKPAARKTERRRSVADLTSPLNGERILATSSRIEPPNWERRRLVGNNNC